MPRKTRGWLEVVPAPTTASMRPRPDAAENSRNLPPDSRDVGASMRPRPDAAENMDTSRESTTVGKWLQ